MPSISWICQRASMLEPITLFLRLFFCSLCYLSWIKVFLGFDMHSTITLRTCPFSNFVHFPMLVGRLFFMIQSIRKLMLLEAEQKCKYMSLELSRLTVQKLQYLTVIQGAQNLRKSMIFTFSKMRVFLEVPPLNYLFSHYVVSSFLQLSSLFLFTYLLVQLYIIKETYIHLSLRAVKERFWLTCIAYIGLLCNWNNFKVWRFLMQAKFSECILFV